MSYTSCVPEASMWDRKMSDVARDRDKCHLRGKSEEQVNREYNKKKKNVNTTSFCVTKSSEATHPTSTHSYFLYQYLF